VTASHPDDSMLQALHDGVTREDRRGDSILYRLLRPTDDIPAITDLLHRAYAPLAAAGLHYLASHQSAEVTSRRLSQGDAVVAVAADRIIGVITLASATATGGSPLYDRADVARFGQFAVEPQCQGAGVGSSLLTIVEELARERGVQTLGLDTSEHASALIQFYRTKGYQFIEFVRWADVNYRSVVMAKELGPTSGGALAAT
jgi:GNAT superfamily N-acetyltransferase